MKVLKWIGISLFILMFLVVGAVLVLHWQNHSEKYNLSDELRAQAPGQFVSLTHGHTHYRITLPAGQQSLQPGPVVVLVHGFSIPMEVWGDMPEALAQAGFQVLQYDLYGRGYSDKPERAYNGQFFETQLIELLDALEIEQPVSLAGLSMGGAITARVAANNPERVNKVAFVAPLHQPFPVPPMPQGIGYYMMSAFYVPGLRGGLIDEAIPQRHSEAMLNAYDAQQSHRGFTKALTSSLYHFTTENHPGNYRRVGELGIPAMLIWGTDDKVVPFSGHEAVQSDLPIDPFVVVEGADHTPHLEQPQLVQAELIEFLRRD